MSTPLNSNKRILIYKKSKQRQLSEVNLGNTFTNCGLFNKKFASHKKNSTKSSVVHSPFHNSLLSSLNLQIDDNMNSSHKENIFNRDIIIKKRNDKVICKKRFNMLSETEETLLTNAIQKRKKVFPKIFNVSTKYSSRGKIKQNASLKTNLSNKTVFEQKNSYNQIKKKANDKAKKLLGNLLVVQKVAFIHNRLNHQKQFSLDNFNIASLQMKLQSHHKPLSQYKEKYYSNDNIINDDLDYMPIRSVIYNKDDEKLRNVSL